MESNKREKIIISVGGTLIVPEKGIDAEFLMNLNDFVRNQLAQNPKRQFFLVAGGGSMARHYRDAGREVVQHDLSIDDLDLLGIQATRLNAHLLRTVFRDIAFPHIIDEYDIITKVKEPVVVAAGWKPGWSIDYCATLIAEDYDIKTIINISPVNQLYTKDPRKYKDAKPLGKISWDKFRSMVGDTWSPGLHAAFDPIAAKKAQELGLHALIMHDFKNVANYLNGKKFTGTVIE